MNVIKPFYCITKSNKDFYYLVYLLPSGRKAFEISTRDAQELRQLQGYPLWLFVFDATCLLKFRH